MPKVTADHFRALGAQQFRDGEPMPVHGTTWQVRERRAGWLAEEAECVALTAKRAYDESTQPGWCDECTPDNCPGCGNAMLAMTAQESNQSTQRVRGSFIVADVVKGQWPDVRKRFVQGRPLTVADVKAIPDYTAPCAYLRRSRYGWVVMEAVEIDNRPVTIHSHIKRKTHARNVAIRMGYQIVDEPA